MSQAYNFEIKNKHIYLHWSSFTAYLVISLISSTGVCQSVTQHAISFEDRAHSTQELSSILGAFAKLQEERARK